MEALKLIGAGHRVLLVRDDLVKLVDLGSIFSSAPKKEYLFSVKDITSVDIKKPTAFSPGSIRIQGHKIAPALRNEISVSFTGDENYKIAFSMQQHIKVMLEKPVNPISSNSSTSSIPVVGTSGIETEDGEGSKPDLEDHRNSSVISVKSAKDNPFYSVFQELKHLFLQTDLCVGNYHQAQQSINDFISLSGKIPSEEFDTILNCEMNESGFSYSHSVFGSFISYEKIISYLKRKLKKLDEILPECESFEEAYNDLSLVEIYLSKNALPVRLNIGKMPEIKCSPVGKKFNADSLSSFIVLDTETTGLRAKNDYIIELSAIRFDEYEPSESFSTLIKPPIDIPESVSEINHITSSMVSDAPLIEEVMPAFINFCGSFPIVGHNLPFDLKFLYVNGFDLSVKRKYFDTLSISRRIKDFSLENYKLDTVCRAFGIYRDDAHRALSDCLATGLLFDEMTQYITTN